MEIPTKLKDLYMHWEYHTHAKDKINTNVNPTILSEIKKFAIERQKIWERKTKNHKPPLTKDKILQTYRFCNVYRELDSQTIKIHSDIKSLKKNFELWLLNVLFYRLVCNPNTVSQSGLLTYDSTKNKEVYSRLKKIPKPKYGSAYIFPVSLIMKSAYQTREEFFCKYLPKITDKCAKVIRSFKRLSVSEALHRVLPVFGFNLKFHWTEVLIDIAYQFPDYIDLYKRFPIGPGSSPTMRLLSPTTTPEETCLIVSRLPFSSFPNLSYNNKPVLLSAENWEGIGCEYRKYLNLKKGKGRRRLYKSK